MSDEILNRSDAIPEQSAGQSSTEPTSADDSTVQSEETVEDPQSEENRPEFPEEGDNSSSEESTDTIPEGDSENPEGTFNNGVAREVEATVIDEEGKEAGTVNVLVAKYEIVGLVDQYDEQMNITGQFPIGSIQEFSVEEGNLLCEEGRAKIVTE